MNCKIHPGDMDAELATAINAAAEGLPELWDSQRIRAAAAGAVFAAARPAFTPDDEDNMGLILADLAGWVIKGHAYDPGPIMRQGEAILKGAAA